MMRVVVDLSEKEIQTLVDLVKLEDVKDEWAIEQAVHELIRQDEVIEKRVRAITKYADL